RRFIVLFFFSSRRRHTRSKRDWSSDVCSSDLLRGRPGPGTDARRNRRWLPAEAALPPYRRSVIFEVATRLLFHTMLVFAVFLLFSGRNAPGGGCVARLVGGIALTV